MMRHVVRSLMLLGLMLSLTVALLNLHFIAVRNQEDRSAIAAATDIQANAQRLARYSTEAASGSPDAFDTLLRSWSAVGRQLNDLRNGSSKGVPPITSNHDAEPALVAVERAWRPTSDKVQQILGARETTLEFVDNVSDFGVKVLPLQTQSDALARLLSERGADANQIYIASRQVAIAERLLRRLADICGADENGPIVIDSFGRDAQIFGVVLRGLMNGDPERGIARVALPEAQDLLQQLSSSLAEIEPLVAQILQNATEMFEARQAANAVLADAEILHREAEALALRYSELGSQRVFPSISVARWACVIALLAAGLLLFVRSR